MRLGVSDTQQGWSETTRTEAIFSQEASANLLAGRGNGNSGMLFNTDVLHVVSVYI